MEVFSRFLPRFGKASSNGVAREDPLDLSLTVNLVLCGLGAGILSMPWSLAGAGVINGICWTLATLAVCYFTILLLVEAGERRQCFSLEDLLEEAAPGGVEAKRAWRASCICAIWITNFLCLVGYLTIIADSTLPILGSVGALQDLSLHGSHARHVILVGAMICILPLCFLNQHQLAFTSTLGTFSNCFIVFAIVWNFVVQEAEDDSPGVLEPGREQQELLCLLSSPFTQGNGAFVGTMLMAVVIQACMLPMFQEMSTEGAASGKAQRTPQNFARALRVAFAILFFLFSVFSVVGYLTFGSKTQGNILNNLSEKEWYTVVSRLCMLGVCTGVYPLVLYPMLAPLGQGRCRTLGIAGINVSALIVAFLVQNLGAISVVCGALSVFFLVGLYPAVIARGVLRKEGAGVGGSAASFEDALLPPRAMCANGQGQAEVPRAWQSASFLWALVLGSFVAMVLALLCTSNDARHLHEHCLWAQ